MLCHFLWHSCDSAAESKQGTNPKMALSLEMFGSFFICLFWWEFCTPLNSNTPTHVGWIYPAACCVTGNLCLPPSPCSVTPSVTPSPCSVTPLHPLPSLTPVNVNPPSQVPPDPTLSAPVTGLPPALFALILPCHEAKNMNAFSTSIWKTNSAPSDVRWGEIFSDRHLGNGDGGIVSLCR